MYAIRSYYATDDTELATWNVEWTAPQTGGAVLFHAAANSANGDYIADWVMTAYGKSPEETFQSVA